MHKNIFYILIIVLSTTLLHSQSIESKKRMSAITNNYTLKEINEFDSKLVFSEFNNQTYVSAFIKVNESFNMTLLNDYNILVGTVAGDIITLKIPIEKVSEFLKEENGIEFIQLDNPVYINLEEARLKTNVDLVHNGISLPQSYSGKDVVVGVIDVGFDYTHPTFYNESGTKYRVKRIWEQKSNGTPPNNYSYGNEITDTLLMIANQTDNTLQSHGTHVSGIASGSGYGSITNEYRGIAYESDIVLVGITPSSNQWLNTGMTDIIDGLNYIFDYAESISKPAVANLSWGCTIGPHDGSSLFSQAVNNLTGPGKIFTISAGNNGEDNIHISKKFSSSDTVLQTFAQIAINPNGRKTWIDIWGEQNETFCVSLSTYSGTTFQNTTNYFCINDNSFDTYILGSDGDTLFINASISSSDINGKPHVLLDLNTETNNLISLAIKGNKGEVHAWMGYVYETSGYYGSFKSNNRTNYTNGNNEMTIGEMACTESAITVAAYASKNSFLNNSGQTVSYTSYVQTDDICPFSSHGPTLNWYSKPDISAPGMTISSAVNSYDLRYRPGGSSYNKVVHSFVNPNNSQSYYFAEMSGTSMSSPVVAGIIALLLEANPNATPEDIKMLMKFNAIKDGFTTNDPNPEIWGSGKINAHEMLMNVSQLDVKEENNKANFIYPNPFSNYLNINFKGQFQVVISNNLGQICSKTIIKSNNLIDTQNLDKGSYFITIYDENNHVITKEKLIKI